MSDIKNLQQQIADFVKERDWQQFHNPKDLAISLNLEASEVLELFQWKTETEIAQFIATNKDAIADELADVFYWVLLMASGLNIDIMAASQKKLQKNIQKYPASRAKGNHKKYTDL